jgi:hypothetical protein
MIALALANWGKVIVGILFLSITIYVGFLKLQNHALRNEADTQSLKVKEQQIELKEWKRVYGILTDELARQNKAVNELGERKKEADSKRIQAEKKASAIVAQARQSENSLQRVPVAESAACEAEMATIHQLLDTSR